MKTIAASITALPVAARDRLAAAAFAIVLGLAAVYVAGFAGSDTLHAAAHDSRHAFAFPCH